MDFQISVLLLEDQEQIMKIPSKSLKVEEQLFIHKLMNDGKEI